MSDVKPVRGNGAQIVRSAVLSPCKTYRYRLERFWSGEHALPFIMLNPSTADAEIDDPTIRRCTSFARREGAGGIIVANLYAFRATKPSALITADDPIGPENAAYLSALAAWARRAGKPIVCAWGAHAPPGKEKLLEGARLVCLGKTANGLPRHPLYVRADQPLVPFP